MIRAALKISLLAIAAFVGLEIIAALLFMTSGLYNIAADQPHLRPVRWMLQAGRTRAVEFRSRGMNIPNLRDSSLLHRGLVLFRKNCQPCHGAPGVPNEQIGRGIDPKPPPLVIAINHWSNSELFWITAHGLKLSGMPGFAPRLSETDLWSIVAFLRRMVFLSPADYKRMVAAADQGLSDPSLDWPPNDDFGFRQLKARGNAITGRQLIQSYGCTSCHTMPGFGESTVGPPLTQFAERQYIAGSLVNVPSNTAAFITNPKQFKPQTAMPNLGVQLREAVDMTAYLYTSGDPERLNALQTNLRIWNASAPK